MPSSATPLSESIATALIDVVTEPLIESLHRVGRALRHGEPIGCDELDGLPETFRISPARQR